MTIMMTNDDLPAEVWTMSLLHSSSADLRLVRITKFWGKPVYLDRTVENASYLLSLHKMREVGV